MALLNCPDIDINVQVEQHGGTPLHGKLSPHHGFVNQFTIFQLGSAPLASLLLFLGYRLELTVCLAATNASQCEITALLLARGANNMLQNKLGLTSRQEARGNMIDVYQVFETKVCVRPAPFLCPGHGDAPSTNQKNRSHEGLVHNFFSFLFLPFNLMVIKGLAALRETYPILHRLKSLNPEDRDSAPGTPSSKKTKKTGTPNPLAVMRSFSRLKSVGVTRF